MFKMDNLLPDIRLSDNNIRIPTWRRFRLMISLKGHGSQIKIIKIIMGPGRADSVKSRKYNPMVVAYVQVSHYNFNTRINVQNFCKIAQKF